MIECHCYLVIYKKNKNMINHKFTVYSKFDENKKIIPKYAKCNNCEALHYVTDVCRSEIKAGKDQSEVVANIDDIALMLPQKLTNVLRKYNANVSDWEHALDIINSRKWNDVIVLKRDIIDEIETVKILTIHSNNKFEIKTEKINNIIVGNQW